MPALRHKVEHSDKETDQILYRILDASHCHTCQELADFFEVSLSFAKQATKEIQETGIVPNAWLVVLMRMHNIHPEWILNGCGPRFVTITPQGHYPSHEAFTAYQQEQDALRSVSLDALLYEVKRRAMMACYAEQ